MISLKRYLDLDPRELKKQLGHNSAEVFPSLLRAYRAALNGLAEAANRACPPTAAPFKERLDCLGRKLSDEISPTLVDSTETELGNALQDWGQQTFKHLKHKADEIKELLIVLAKSAEAVGQRDQRCAAQLHECTDRLQHVANLDDITEVRSSILRTASELKTSITRMAEEGQAAINQLRSEVSVYQSRLEEAERVALRDSLTGLRNRHCIESHIERRMQSSLPFCVVLLDLNDFKYVNDTYGHPVGDELLKQFAFELQSASRSTDIIGRWGGDEFIIVLDCEFTQAAQRTERLRQWVNGDYTLDTHSGKIKLPVSASIGLVERYPGEPMKDIIARVDANMYTQKATSKAAVVATK